MSQHFLDIHVNAKTHNITLQDVLTTGGLVTVHLLFFPQVSLSVMAFIKSCEVP